VIKNWPIEFTNPKSSTGEKFAVNAFNIVSATPGLGDTRINLEKGGSVDVKEDFSNVMKMWKAGIREYLAIEQGLAMEQGS
jgi:hypothetical protein